MTAPRVVAACALCLGGIFLMMLSSAAITPELGKGTSAAATQKQTSGRPLVTGSIGKRKNLPKDPNSGPGWSIVGSPNNNVTIPNGLAAVTCVSMSQCWAVGSYSYVSNNITISQTLIEQWDGRSWKIVNSPNTGARSNVLQAVACTSGSACTAAGSYVNNNGVSQTLIEQWNGSSWTVVPSANTVSTQNNYLNGVACLSVSQCWAVGYYTNGSGTSQTLIEEWDGASWTIVTSQNSSTTQRNVLQAVTCSSAAQCWAVGYYINGNTAQTLTEQWNDSSWTIVGSPSSGDSALYAVTCISDSQCWAVGDFFTSSIIDRTLTEEWDGSSWAIVDSPNTSATANDNLRAVVCTSGLQCWAAGSSSESGGTDQALIEEWNGSSWTVSSTPAPAETGYLNGITCASDSECWSVGAFGNPSQTLVEQWDGNSWASVPSPNGTTAQNNTLTAVTCPSSSQCWAVGYAGFPFQGVTLIEHWDGESWKLVPSPNQNVSGQQAGALADVWCVSASQCWAVGSYVESNIDQTLIEQWDGSSWSIVPSPNSSPSQDNALDAVTCLSGSDCWAAGDYYDANTNFPTPQTLIEHWDGTSWVIVPSPNVDNTNVLTGITCTSSSDCWAVGYHEQGINFSRTLVQHWDGTSWSAVTSPNTSDNDADYLNGVACTTSTECWAVGYVITSPDNFNLFRQTLIERWDGSSWSIVMSPDTGDRQNNVLNGVLCVSDSDCWAVGNHSSADFSSSTQTLVEHWDGNGWLIVSSADASSTGNAFNGLTCISASQCWAVGIYDINNGSAVQTLIGEYSLSIPPLLGIESRMTHGAAGTFDVDLPVIGDRGVECRNGNGNYSVVFSFVNDIANCGTATATGGSVVSGPNSNQCTENLTGVPNAQYIDVGLSNVVDSQNNPGNVSVEMGVLIGDVNADGRVDGNDVSAVQSNTRQPVSGSTYRYDVDVNGRIDGNDVSATQARTRTSLPSPP